MPQHNEPSLLHLRGTFLLPELREQGLLQRIGDGSLFHAISIDEEHMIVHTEIAVSLYSLSTQSILWEIDCPSFNCAIACQSNLLALVVEDTTIILWDLRTGQIAHRLVYQADNEEYKVNPNGLEFNHDGSILAAGMRSRTRSIVALWNTNNGHLLRTLPLSNFLDDITTLAFHPSDNILAGGSFNNHKVWLWDLDDRHLLTVWELADGHDRPYDLAFNPDGTLLFVSWGTAGLRIWNVEQEQELPGPTGGLHPTWLAVDPNGRYLAVAHFGGVHHQSVRLLEIGTWQMVYEFAGDLRPFFSLDGQLLALTEEEERSVHLRQVTTGQELRQLTLRNE